jgi:hypothetical protein
MVEEAALLMTSFTYGEYKGLMLELQQLRGELRVRDELLAAAYADLREARNLLAKSRRETLEEVRHLFAPVPSGLGPRGNRVPEPVDR